MEQGAEIVVMFDADGQMRSSEIRSLIEPIERNEADVVLGSRFLGSRAVGQPLVRRMMLRGAVLFTRFSTGLKLSDVHNGFRVLSRKAAMSIRITQNRMAHASEILTEIARLKLDYVERPVTIDYTDYSRGKGQTNLRGAADILTDLFWRKR